jgi:hypothetical protein
LDLDRSRASFGTENGERFEARGPPRRYVARQQRNDREDRRHANKGTRIVRRRPEQQD